MSKNEPPIFGENGAVLNSETMTDEWRAEHNAQASQPYNTPIWKIAFACSFMALVYFLPRQYMAIATAILSAIVIIKSLYSRKR